MTISILITALLFIPSYILTMRYNFHMFQLNGYKNAEHIHWFKKNMRQQWTLLFGIIIGVAALIFPHILIDVFICLILLVNIIVYMGLKRSNTKKNLVYTSRIKRLLFTDILLTIISVALSIIFIPNRAAGFFLILVSMQFILNIFANIINYPIEHLIRKHYINDAKKILKSMPNLTIIGVTGSYGKTSVKFYLQTLLQEEFNVLVTPESYNTPMGVVKTIRESLKPTHDIFICEMGARHVGDIKEICDIVHPHHGLITSIGPQHLETFFNIENIQKTKFELADSLPQNGLLFLNGDNSYIQEKAKDYSNVILYFSEHKGSGYCTSNIIFSQLGTDFTVSASNGETEQFQMKLIGFHNIINVVGAIAVANQLGISLKNLKVPVRRLQPVEHRMQLKEHGNITIIDDAYNSNPIGSKAAVETLALFDGTKILITPGMVELGNKEEEYNYKFGGYAAACCDYILLVGKRRGLSIMNGALDNDFPKEKCMLFNKFEDAISYAYSIKTQEHKYILLENDLPDNY